MLDSKNGRADMSDVEDGISVDIRWLSSDMSSEGWLLVKDGDVVGRLAADCVVVQLVWCVWMHELVKRLWCRKVNFYLRWTL
jgi:hypothetical protein